MTVSIHVTVYNMCVCLSVLYNCQKVIGLFTLFTLFFVLPSPSFVYEHTHFLSLSLSLALHVSVVQSVRLYSCQWSLP